MKKLIIGLALSLGLATTGCATLANWYDQFVSNPAQAVQTIDTTIQTILSDVALAWNVIQPLIPAASLPAVTSAYQTGVASLNHAETALNAGLAAAATAKQANPNLGSLISDAQTAATNLIAIVNQYGGNVTGLTVSANSTPPPPVPGLDDAKANLAVLNTWH